MSESKHKLRNMSESETERMATLYLLALCLWREARGEPIEGKVAVADVILTRAADPRWPDSVAGVITQRYQFSAFNRTDPNVTKFPDPGGDPLEWAAFVECASVAATALANGPSGSADHYHATSMEREPEWSFKMRRVGEIGGHVFYDSKSRKWESD